MYIPKKSKGKGRKGGKRTGKTAVARSLTVNQKKEVNKLINGKAETKYVAAYPVNQGTCATTIITPLAFASVIPNLSQGVLANNRVGNKVGSSHGFLKLSFSLLNSSSASQNWMVRVFVLASKKVKTYPLIASLPAGQLLDVGDNTTTDWNPSTVNVVALSHMPISREDYTVLKTFNFCLSKNNGNMNNDATAGAPASANSTNMQHKTVVYNWRHKSSLIYDETGTLPTNYAPVYCYVAYPLDGYDIREISSAPIVVTSTIGMYFKDE